MIKKNPILYRSVIAIYIGVKQTIHTHSALNNNKNLSTLHVNCMYDISVCYRKITFENTGLNKFQDALENIKLNFDVTKIYLMKCPKKFKCRMQK